MKIRINDRMYETGVVRNGNELSLGIIGNDDIAAIYAAFAPNTMPEVKLYDDEDKISAIYANHKVTGVSWNPDSIQVTLVVDPLEVSEATRLNEAIEAQSESTSVSDDAIAELAEIVAALEERLGALEDAFNSQEGDA